MKKLLIGAGIGLLLIVSALIVLPFTVDVDRFRPQIQKLANEKINGELTLGALDLSLWGKISVVIEGINLVDANREQVIQAERAYFNFPFWDLLTGSATIVLEIKEPEIMLARNADGSINLGELVKEEDKKNKDNAPDSIPETSDTEKTGSSEPSPPATKQNELPELVNNAAVSVKIEDANLIYLDKETNNKQTISQLNLNTSKIALNQPLEIRIGSNLDISQDQLKLEGDWEIIIDAQPRFTGSRFDEASFTVDGDFDSLSIAQGEVFRKKPGVPLKLEAKGTVNSNSLGLESLILVLGELNLQANAKINFEPLDYRIQLKHDQFVLQKFNDIVPPLKNLLKEELALQTDILLTTDKLDTMKIDLRSSGTLATLSGQVENFAAPSINLSLKAEKINLDSLLGLDAQAQKDENSKKAPETTQTPGQGSNSNKSPAGDPKDEAQPIDVDKMLAEVLAAEIFSKLKAKVLFQIESLTVTKVKASELLARITFENKKLLVQPIKLGVFNGNIQANMQANLGVNPPTYQLTADVQGIDLKEATKTQLESFQNTMTGNLSTSFEGKGRSFNSDKLLASLAIDGEFKLADAQFVTVDIGQMVDKGLGDAIANIRKRIKELPDYKPKKLPAKAFGFEIVSSDFSMRDGELRAPNFSALAYENKGVDVEGITTVNLIKDQLSANWALVDTYNKTGLKDIDVKNKNFTVEEVFVKNGEPIKIPVVVGCKLSAPCYDYKSIPAALIGTATKNLKGVAKQKLKAEVDKLKDEQKEKLKKEEKKLKNKLEEKAKGLLKGKKLPF